MVVRIWRTGIDEAREEEYRRFEQERSLPMFRQQAGFRGVVFLRTQDGAAALTVWDSTEAIDRLAESPSYLATVEALLATRLLRGEQTVEVMEVASLELGALPRG